MGRFHRPRGAGSKFTNLSVKQWMESQHHEREKQEALLEAFHWLSLSARSIERRAAPEVSGRRVMNG
jgi:hypothetical protein